MHTKLALVCTLLQVASLATAAEDFSGTDYVGKAPANLQYAFIIFRHGIRSPFKNIYDNEDEYDKAWPGQPIQQLTQRGMRLMEHVGRSLRTRYKHLHSDLDTDYVRVTSTASPRTAKSAELVISGMFPAADDVQSAGIVQEGKSGNYITTWDKDKAFLFDYKADNTKCKRYTHILDEIKRNEMKRFSRGQRQLIGKLNANIKSFNLPVKPLTTADNVVEFWDNYKMAELEKKPIPPWIAAMMPQLTGFQMYRNWLRIDGKTDGKDSIVQYYTGPMLHDVMREAIKRPSKCFQEILEQKTSAQKSCAHLHFHGSHDNTLLALMWAMVGNMNYVANPGDTLILEADGNNNMAMYLYSPLSKVKKFDRLSLKKLCGRRTCGIRSLIIGLHKFSLIKAESLWQEKCNKANFKDEKSKWRTRNPSLLYTLLMRIVNMVLSKL